MSARDSAVEAAAEAARELAIPHTNKIEPWEVASPAERDVWLRHATAAIDAYEHAMAEAGWVFMQAGKIDKAAVWPAACKHPNSCARHRQCMYLGCEHQGFDIGAQIDAAVATLGKGAEK